MITSATGSAADTSQHQPLRVVIGVGGGIAAFKAAHLVRYFTEAGHHVNVIPTRSALEFVGAATFEALSGNPVSTGVFENVDEVQHVRLGQQADLIVIAPATADLLARLAMGRADDLLTSSCLVATCPIVLAPAMHTEMWDNAATRANVRTLRERGFHIIEPAHGRLTGKDTGAGRLPDPEHIGSLALSAMRNHERDIFRQSLVGKRVVISAGGTEEPIDPVRFLTNASSGRQGYALADIATQRGAEVTLISASTEVLPVPSGAKVVKVRTAMQLQEAMQRESAQADLVIMAAAVADYRPEAVAASKMKKDADTDLSTLHLVENPDILVGLVQARENGEIPQQTVIVGFAAETGDEDNSPLDHAKRKLKKKGCDLLMCNAVGEGKVFGQEDNAGWLLNARRSEGTQDGEPVIVEVPAGPKLDVAACIIDEAETLLGVDM
ncbi:bifunctional phosphopantothenoylcysteine decarboxylase/phosphopantothenate--cysteine ligase CoaBC [uncultured Corynebacterium sp.]|uniref:bifunctional phosphopantothenoylcysteine decarboxylase/phosphopantothenate--cysteine ligase CoaBC n=1 Tax=uncultured Corynebacterium sp. TaxID=159447 RepID=UPI002594192D|nr:bifunctional phosphopantothenoylcysteine decarboxylase/phosphopantothenate--cysteine ligase CoaBC [uncultured Corynebacterium sp.]